MTLSTFPSPHFGVWRPGEIAPQENTCSASMSLDFWHAGQNLSAHPCSPIARETELEGLWCSLASQCKLWALCPGKDLSSINRAENFWRPYPTLTMGHHTHARRQQRSFVYSTATSVLDALKLFPIFSAVKTWCDFSTSISFVSKSSVLTWLSSFYFWFIVLDVYCWI